LAKAIEAIAISLYELSSILIDSTVAINAQRA
jgi:hypothetical protein